jgi:two-component system, cell cycle sensor histidine kinase and response regulator CckA
VGFNTNKIRQLLDSLIINACEAMDERTGVVSVNIRTVSSTSIPSAHRWPVDFQPGPSGFACLEVTDQGCGIAEEALEIIFDPFYTTKFTGRGLGLPLVLSTVKSHDGCITVESEPGKGSIFRVFLPLLTEAAPLPEATVPHEGDTMLLVEDDPAVREIGVMMLKHLGYTVLDARDGVDAVAVYQRHQDVIRCVLTDLTMPRMDGWDTLAALRKIDPGVPVILASGYDQAEVMAGDHPELPQAFLRKPYSIAVLKETLARTMTGKRSEA